MLAEKGYIIWVCDNRTASNKGVNSAWPLYKNFGELELRDLEDGFAWLKSQPYVDGSRIGIWGWSYGGFMTSYALTQSVTWTRRRTIKRVTGRALPFTSRKTCTANCS